MARTIFLRFLPVIFLVGVFSILVTHAALAFSGSGSGTSGDPYIITTCSQLQEMSSALSSDYKLGNNIDCNVSPYNTGTGFTPLGDDTTQFSGAFNGAGNSISGLFIDDTSANYGGLFGYVNGATIKNVELKSVNITGGLYVGGLVGQTDGTNGVTIDKVEVSGSVSASGNASVGGLVGLFSVGTVSNVYATAAITGAGQAGSVINAGGLVGYDSGTIENSYATGDVTATNSGTNSDAYAGGLVGQTAGSSSVIIKNSYATGTASASGATINNDMGGLAGFCGSGGSITNSYSVSTPLCGVANATINGGSAGGVSLSSFYKTSPLYSVYTATLAWGFDNTWVFNDTNSLPVFTWPVTQTTSVSSSSSGSSSAPSCGDSVPTSAPDLFQIDTSNDKAILYFAPSSGSVNKYMISYGLTSGDNRFGVEFPQNQQSGVVSYAISYLTPNTTYYFRVRGGNGCMPGAWGNEMKITTTKNSKSASSYYESFAEKLLSFLPSGY